MKTRFLSVAAACVLAVTSFGFSQVLAKGTSVLLAFDQSFSSRTAHKGDQISLHVVNNISLGSHVVIRKGAKVTARILDVVKSGRFGRNAQIKMSLSPIRSHGVEIPLQPRQKGNMIGGEKGTETAAAAGAGAIVLGPIGLGAGYFVVGHSVNVKTGDKMETQVAEDVPIK